MNYPKYEFTRTIRFALSGQDENKLRPNIDGIDQKQIQDDFLRAYVDLLMAFREAVFDKDKNNEQKTKPHLEVKKLWLRQFARESFYELDENKRQKNKYTVAEAGFLQDILADWLKRNSERLQKIRDIFDRTENNNAKRSDLSLLIRELESQDFFQFIRQLTMPGIANDKDSNEFLEKLHNLVEQFELLLDQMLFFVAPDSSQGIEVSRASFNYYTINKVSKNFDENIKKAGSRLSDLYNGRMDEQFLKKVGFMEYLEYEYKKTINNISLQDLYNAMKKFKSAQKRDFNLAIQVGESLQKLNQKFPLFEFKDNNQINLQKFINADRKKRGEYFRNKWGFPDYVEFCDEVFKPVAMATGKLKAEIRALEQEKIDARLLRYWAHILRKENEYFLLLTLKEKRQEVKKFLETMRPQKSGGYEIFGFNSLTLRALKKLIRRNLDKEQERLKNDAVKLCQEVLRGEHDKIQLDFGGFEEKIKEIADSSYANEEELRTALERVAYCLSEQNVSGNDIQKLKNDFGVLELKISSYDFERNIVGAMKEHSCLWENFWHKDNWNANFPVRLNPDLRIYYRPKREGQESKKQNNRFSKDHLGVAFTITQNATQERMDTAFVHEKALMEMVKKFNNEIIGQFIEDCSDNLYYYGIDRGQNELATLCVTRFSKEQYEAMLADGTVKRLDKPIFPEIKTFRIKDENLRDKKEIIIDSSGKKKTVTLFKNPSYFIDEEDEFEEVISPFIDLTTAKLIKGKIILNGDMQTYINLKKANGKRQLFEKFSKIGQESSVEFDETEKRFQIKSVTERNHYQFLPYYLPEQEKILPRDEMKKYLQDYLDKLRFGNAGEDSVSIEQINHLRDAITSNMVGIIAFLFEKYPGIIKLENLHGKNEIEKHFRDNNENIARRLEWSLYKKFQKIGLVPPRLRQIVFLRENEVGEDKKLNQFGIVHFVPTENTSANCPYCGKSVSMQQRNEDKFKHHAYICRNNSNCGFDTTSPKFPLELIKNSDDVAAYNIAKKRI